MASVSTFEINDTLQISSEQGFPLELHIEEHLKNPFLLEQFTDRIYTFH